MGKVANQIFQKYEGMADYYANKIWNEHHIGMEKADIQQELKMRMFQAIRKYAQRWREFKQGIGVEPIPIEFYIRTTLINKSNEFKKQIQRNSEYEYRIEGATADRGQLVDNLEIQRTDIILGSQRLSELFEKGDEVKMFRILVMTSFDREKAMKIFNGKRKPRPTCEKVLRKLRKHLEHNQSEIVEFSVFVSEV